MWRSTEVRIYRTLGEVGRNVSPSLVEPGFGRAWPRYARDRPKVGRCWPRTKPKVGRTNPKFGRDRLNVIERGPDLVEVSPHLVEVHSTMVEQSPTCVEEGPNLVEPIVVASGQLWSKSAGRGQIWRQKAVERNPSWLTLPCMLPGQAHTMCPSCVGLLVL